MNAIAERLREACAARQRLRIAGAGTWLDAGRPVDAQETLSLADHRGIVEYVPGDLTLTARAGTRLSEIAADREHRHSRTIRGRVRPAARRGARHGVRDRQRAGDPRRRSRREERRRLRSDAPARGILGHARRRHRGQRAPACHPGTDAHGRVRGRYVACEAQRARGRVARAAVRAARVGAGKPDPVRPAWHRRRHGAPREGGRKREIGDGPARGAERARRAQ